MNFERARAMSDAVLMEGYAPYPYRASAPKNRDRWTFGVLAPQPWSVAGGGDAWWLQTQVLVAGAPRRLAGRLRFFQVERRRNGDAAAWDEGVLRTVDFEIPEGRASTVFGFEGGCDVSPLGVRERHPVVGRLVIEREPLVAEHPLTRVSIKVENHTTWHDVQASRSAVMLGAFASVHLLIGVEEGAILSAVDPPAWARAEAARCSNVRIHPVLVGPPGSDDLVLAAPFIMQDRADALSPEWLARMHGAARDLVGGEMVPSIQPPQLGAKVRLLPPKVRTDAQDLLYAGHVATVVELREDVDGTLFLGVTVDDDPAAELHRWYGRCHYYRLEEVELL